MSDGEGILIAEDNPDDTFFLKRALAKAGVIERPIFVRNGREAMRYLASGASDHGFPKVILLDLVMPELGGLPVLEWLKGQNELKEVPLVVFTGIEDPTYLNRAVALGVRRCYAKHPDPSTWVEMIRELAQQFGLRTATSIPEPRVEDLLAA